MIRIRLRIVQLFMAIGVAIAALFFPFFILGTFLWSKFIVLLSRLLYRGFDCPVTGVGKFLTPDKIFKRPNSTLVTLAILGQTPNEENVLKHMQHIYDLEDGNHSREDEFKKRKYAKLAYSVEPWCGYLFWKKVQHFDLKNQIHFIYNKELDHKKVSDFVEQIIRKPFVKGEPLWEVFVVTNCPQRASPEELAGNKCFVIWRIHHILTDGMSLIKLWYMQDSALESNQVPVHIPRPFKFNASAPQESKGRDNSWRKFLRKWSIIVYRAPFLSNKYLCVPGDDNCLTKGHKEFKDKWFCSGLNKIYLEQYRPSLRKLQFSLTHALLVGYARGLKRFVGENFGVANIPKAVKIMGSIPRSNHPDDEALTNHWAVMRYKAYLTSDDLMEQLEHSKKEYKRAVHDVIPDAFELAHDVGMVNVPTKFYELLWDTKKAGTLSLSNLPGPTTPQNMFNIPVTDRAVWLPIVRRNSGIGLLLLTYNGWGTVSITADSGCIKTKELFDKFNNAVMEEMQFVLEEVTRIAENFVEPIDNQKLSQFSEQSNSFIDDVCELREVTVL